MQEQIDEVKTNVMEISGEVCTYAWRICSMHNFVCVCVCVCARAAAWHTMYAHERAHSSLDLFTYMHVSRFKASFRTSCSKTKFSAIWKLCTLMAKQ